MHKVRIRANQLWRVRIAAVYAIGKIQKKIDQLIGALFFERLSIVRLFQMQSQLWLHIPELMLKVHFDLVDLPVKVFLRKHRDKVCLKLLHDALVASFHPAQAKISMHPNRVQRHTRQTRGILPVHRHPKCRMTAHQSAYGKLPGLIVIFLPLRRMAQLIGILAGCALAQNAVRSGVQPNSTPGLEL